MLHACVISATPPRPFILSTQPLQEYRAGVPMPLETAIPSRVGPITRHFIATRTLLENGVWGWGVVLGWWGCGVCVCVCLCRYATEDLDGNFHPAAGTSPGPRCNEDPVPATTDYATARLVRLTYTPVYASV
jgi:hypothetical protein